jgi:hypothetical protein
VLEVQVERDGIFGRGQTTLFRKPYPRAIDCGKALWPAVELVTTMIHPEQKSYLAQDKANPARATHLDSRRSSNADLGASALAYRRRDLAMFIRKDSVEFKSTKSRKV